MHARLRERDPVGPTGERREGERKALPPRTAYEISTTATSIEDGPMAVDWGVALRISIRGGGDYHG